MFCSHKTTGTFKLFGVDNKSKDILKVRKKVGAIVETPSIYRNMSAYDNLKMQCEILGIKDVNKRIEDTLETGWSLLRLLPKSELKRIKDEYIEKYL